MNTIRRVLCALLVSCVPIGVIAQDPSVTPQTLSIEGAVTHVYKSINGVNLRLHVFDPPNHAPSTRRPAILFFFGGAWTHGTVEQFVPQARYLAERGMVAGVADYRVFGRHQTSPFEAMADAKSAVRWVRSRAGELGIDPDRIVASGGSSGGHIALSAAVFGPFDEPTEDGRIRSKPDALVLFNPSVDTARARSAVARARFGDRAREGSPLHHLSSGLPPILILHGKSDTTVPYADVESFCAQAKTLGNQCELVGYEDAKHGFFNPQNTKGKWYRETLLEADRFLTKLGYLRGPAPTQIR